MASLPPRRERQVKKISVRVHNVLLDKKLSDEFYSWTNLKELRNFIQKNTGIPPKKQRLFQHHNELLNNHKTLEDLLEDEDDHSRTPSILLTLRYDDSQGSSPPFVRPFMDQLMKNPNVVAVVQSINKGFHKGFIPKAIETGLSGSYFLRGSDKEDLCIFKPFDEEPYAPNNPKGFVGKLHSKGIRPGVLSGEGAAREVAASLLDSKGIHRVPQTFFAELYHPWFQRSQIDGTLEADGSITSPNKKASKKALENTLKFGSLQFLKKNDGSSDDFSCRLFSVEQMQAIAALDIRILNCDRNSANILVRRRPGESNVSIYPIDHSLSFPDKLSITADEVCWTVWPQVEIPTNERLKEYIATFNPLENCKKLKALLGFRPICLRNYRIAETLLIKGTERGLTLGEIGKIIYKHWNEDSSLLERIVRDAEEMTLMNNSPLHRMLKLKTKVSQKSKVSSSIKENPQDLMSDLKTDASDNSNGVTDASEKHTHGDTMTDFDFHPQPDFGPQPSSPIGSSQRKRAQSCLPENEGSQVQQTKFDWDNIILTPIKSDNTDEKPSTLPKEEAPESLKSSQRCSSLKRIPLTKICSQTPPTQKEYFADDELPKIRSLEDKDPHQHSISGRCYLNQDFDNEVFFYYYEQLLSNKLLKISKKKPRERLNSHV